MRIPKQVVKCLQETPVESHLLFFSPSLFLSLWIYLSGIVVSLLKLTLNFVLRSCAVEVLIFLKKNKIIEMPFYHYL